LRPRSGGAAPKGGISSGKDEVSLGDGLYLLDDATDPSSTVVKYKINAEQLAKLGSKSSWQSEVNSISNTVYSKFKDDFDFLFFVLDKKTIIGSSET
jgi:hypothetical protein